MVQGLNVYVALFTETFYFGLLYVSDHYCIIFKNYLCVFFYFWLQWVLVAMSGLSLVAVHGLIVVASLASVHRLQGRQASVVAAPG